MNKSWSSCLRFRQEKPASVSQRGLIFVSNQIYSANYTRDANRDPGDYASPGDGSNVA
jgi:hypothetical protein